jgi:hypothetical protein
VTLFSFFCAASIYSKILKERGYGSLGFYGLGVLYVCLSLTSFIAPSVAGLLKPQKIIQITSISFTLWIVSGLIATIEGASEGLVTFAVMLGSVSNGVGGAIFWVAQGKYLSNCVKICEDKSGLYSSLFWTIALGS